MRRSAALLARRGQERDEQLARAEAANRAKDQFLAVLSHELRTPLTPALVAAELLERRTDLPPDVGEAAAMIRRNVELEVKLIDDLLDLTRVTRGKLQLDRAPVDLHETVKHAAEACGGEARAKGLTLALDLQAAPAAVMGDATRLQQVLWNLVKNAVKFTPAGGRVTVRTRRPAGADRVQVEVADTGVGIDPAVLPRIFDAFEQGGAAVTRQFGGLGLGLAISKALVELHGGTLTAASDGPGRGATFVLALPAAAAGPAAPVRPAARNGDGLAGVRVLLVEDNADTARVMGRVLQGWGCAVTAAGSVAAAAAAAGEGAFDLVLSDLGLPDGSGHDLMRQLAARHGLRGIALSGYGMEADVRESLAAGFAEHLTKPVDLERLEAALRRLVAGGRPGAAGDITSAAPAAAG
jgi:nitrogen-specific signal transduction histidine kinase/ActR/RegA family two-component response regulator